MSHELLPMPQLSVMEDAAKKMGLPFLPAPNLGLLFHSSKDRLVASLSSASSVWQKLDPGRCRAENWRSLHPPSFHSRTRDLPHVWQAVVLSPDHLCSGLLTGPRFHIGRSKTRPRIPAQFPLLKQMCHSLGEVGHHPPLPPAHNIGVQRSS